MGQTASTVGISWPEHRDSGYRKTTKSKSTVTDTRSPPPEIMSSVDPNDGDSRDYVSDLPDECLAIIFHSLASGDRKRCSLVCRRWFYVEGQSRTRLSLDARSDLRAFVPSIFSRFDSVTKLALKCDRREVSIDDETLVLIAVHCRNLTRLKLRACREITDKGIEGFAKNCKGLRKLSCGSCMFGAKGMNALTEHCASLEELSVKRLRGLTDLTGGETIQPGNAKGLKNICLKELFNGQCFVPLIAGSKNLKTLKLFRCAGDWDTALETISRDVKGLTEIHLERLQVSDRGLAAVAGLKDLEVLHLVKTLECTDSGIIAIAEGCKLLRKLHIDGWKTNRIGDEGLIAVARGCLSLQELVLISLNPTSVSLSLLGTNCINLERLALCGSETIGDPELCCIAAKCMSLKKLCIKGCPVSDQGMEALAGGCPNLVKVKVKKCRGVTAEGGEWLRSSRGSVAVNLDVFGEDFQDVSVSDGGGNAPENGGEQPVFVTAPAESSSAANRSTGAKSRLGLFMGRNFVACTFRRWSSPQSGSSSSSNNTS